MRFAVGFAGKNVAIRHCIALRSVARHRAGPAFVRVGTLCVVRPVGAARLFDSAVMPAGSRHIAESNASFGVSEKPLPTKPFLFYGSLKPFLLFQQEREETVSENRSLSRKSAGGCSALHARVTFRTNEK